MNNTIVTIGTKSYKQCSVVMLSTQSAVKDKMLYMDDTKLSLYSGERNRVFTGQHLYIVSNEDIKEGFKGYAIITVKDDKRIKYVQEIAIAEKNQCYDTEGRKFSFEYYEVNSVIATTDTKLLEGGSYYNGTKTYDILPRPSNAFLEAYVKEYNTGKPITDVLVEMVDEGEEGWWGSSYDGEPVWNSCYVLKVAPDNTVIIQPVVKKEYNEEMLLNMHYYMEYCNVKGYVTPKEWLDEHKHF